MNKDDLKRRTKEYALRAIKLVNALPKNATGRTIGNQKFEIRNLKLLDLLFPPLCAGCGEEGSWICRSCFAALRPHKNDRCPLCKKPSFRGFLCVWCRAYSPITQIISVFVYADRLKRIIHAIKFGGASVCIASFAPYLREAYQRFCGAPVDCIIPVPLHVRRLRERGFNQSALFAHAFSVGTSVPILTDILVRGRATCAQAELSREKRAHNVQNAFQCRIPDTIGGVSVLLVDDVCTTGATLADAARALRDAGAREVSALTLAHG